MASMKHILNLMAVCNKPL